VAAAVGVGRRRRLVAAVVDGGSVVEQATRGLEVPVLGGDVQRRVAEVVGGVHVRAAADQQLRNLSSHTQ